MRKELEKITSGFSPVFTGVTSWAEEISGVIARNNLTGEWTLMIQSTTPDEKDVEMHNCLSWHFRIKPIKDFNEDWWETHSSGNWHNGRYDRHYMQVDNFDLEIEVIEQIKTIQ